ncbi:hypothetical protein [Endozoicomonas sp. SCSIO W0465]|uniref:hypothetical protein n=1 Tax=Endozoicomonas sp. SCSIO W0465 TaxID=2918516 RepID=UPI0020760D14|nr:hypothetical protein [Endozoicomonas sp. SCSIO W0465]USE34536.1 hypothetical protein MJO57_20650 [Endozoicomonas sp. SCSIO W0465]
MFNGIPVSTHQSHAHRGRDTTPDEGRCFEDAFWKKKILRGRQITPADVLTAYGHDSNSLRCAFFLQKLCFQNIPHDNRKITPDQVIQEFNRAPDRRRKYQLAIARFMDQCCLKGLVLNGQQVSPGAVVKAFPDTPDGKLGIARFKAECCLRGLPLNGQQVTTDAVVKDYRAARATLELARFMAQCCLRGLPLHGRQIRPDEVINSFPDSPAGKLGIACFKEHCCLRGLALEGRQVTPDAVVKDFPESAEGKLGIARFKAECCLRGLALNGQQITPDVVIKDFQVARATLDLARFKQQCCLRGLALDGQQVTPDVVVADYQAAKATLEQVRFKAECCLRGLLLNGQQVTSDTVVKEYERGGWLLEKAIFYSQLALNARELGSGYLDNQKVLEAFNEVPGCHSSRQVEYLMQRLKQPQWYDETNEAQEIIQQTWEILKRILSKDDEQRRQQCILKFMAMQYRLPIDHQSVSAEEILQNISTLRGSFQNLRLQFFFLAQCYISGQPVDGRPIHKARVLECLQSFPEGSKLRHALSCWFDQFSGNANIMDELLFKRDNAFPEWVSDRRNSYSANCVNNTRYEHRDILDEVIPDTESSCQRAESEEKPVALLDQGALFLCRERACGDETEKAEHGSVARSATVAAAQNLQQTLKQALKIGTQFFPDQQFSQLNTLTLKALEIIQEINGFYSDPPIVITGSYARFLQNLCSSFNDINIICTTEVPARTLFDKLRALNADRGSEIPKHILIWPIRGCQEIKLPKAYNIVLREGDFGTKTTGLQVSVDTRVIHGNSELFSVHVPGVEKPVCCLSFAGETRLLNNKLKYLADNLLLLTGRLQKGEVFDIPRTILFSLPNTTEERIYGLLMRSLLTLNKARQFIALYSEGEPDDWPDQLQEEQQRLHALTEKLQLTLLNHAYRNGFEQSVNRWLSTTRHVNDYEIKRKDLIKGLLAMMDSEQNWVSPKNTRLS